MLPPPVREQLVQTSLAIEGTRLAIELHQLIAGSMVSAMKRPIRKSQMQEMKEALDAIGAEPLENSGFETEIPEPVVSVSAPAARPPTAKDAQRD